MPLTFEQKKAVVGEISEVAQGALSSVVADNCGMTAAEITELRAMAREAGVTVRVAKNTLIKKAVEGTEFECLNSVLTGPTVLTFSIEEPNAAARVLRKFCKDKESIKVKAIALNGELFDASRLAEVASLPSKDEALAQLLRVMNGPVTKLARTLVEFPSQVARVVNAIKDQKEAA